MDFELVGPERDQAIERVKQCIRDIMDCDNQLQVFQPHDNNRQTYFKFKMEEARFELSILLQCLYNI